MAAANLGLFTEAERRLTESNSSPAGEACAIAIAWYLAMTRRSQGNEESAMALLEWLQATHSEPKVTAALKDPSYRLVTTTAEKIASRKDPWDPASVVADNSGRERLLAEAQAELDRQIGLSRVKEQIERYRAATQMAKVRAARGMKVAQQSKHMIFTGPPGTGKTTIARVVANILAGLGVIAEPKLVETSRKDFVAEYEGQSSVKTARTIDRALGGVLFIDEAYTLVQERDGQADPFGTEALDTLLARMENDRDRLVVIIAGYSADIDRLLETNDGLRSRFSTRIEFDSYGPTRSSRSRRCLPRTMIRRSAKRPPSGPRGCDAADPAFPERKPALDIAGNGRYARQLVEAGEQARDMRLAGRWTSRASASSSSARSTARTWPSDRRRARPTEHQRLTWPVSTHHQGPGQRLALPAPPRRARHRAPGHPHVRRSASVLQPRSAAGIILAVVICLGAALLAYFKPLGKRSGDTLLVDRTTNQLYMVMPGIDQLRPVYNLTSARLVLGNAGTPMR